MEPCALCDGLVATRAGGDVNAVAELPTGIVRLAPAQYFRGATFFVANLCVRELHHLPADELAEHCLDLAAVCAAVERTFEPRKLNVESLGNGVPHLHWWITPRYDDDARPRGPIWEDLEFLRALWTEGSRAEPDERDRRRADFVTQLNAGVRPVVRSFTR